MARALRANGPLLGIALVLAGALLYRLLRGGPGVAAVELQALLSGLLSGGVYALVAMGLALIFGVLDVINFAHGAMMALAMYSTYVLVTRTGIDLYLAAVISAPLLFGFGMLVQRTLIAPVLGSAGESQLLLTLGLAIVIENALLIGFGGEPHSVHSRSLASLLPAGVHVGSAVVATPRVVAFAASLLLAAALYLLLHRTRIGTAIRAVAENPRGAALIGLNARRLYAIAFGLGTACVGAAGAFVLPFTSLEPSAGEQYNIVAFVVVVLGGLGSVTGAAAAGIVIGLVQELGGAAFPGVNNFLLVFVVFLVTLVLRPRGLFGRR